MGDNKVDLQEVGFGGYGLDRIGSVFYTCLMENLDYTVKRMALWPLWLATIKTTFVHFGCSDE
jgi:hypothetical protein